MKFAVSWNLKLGAVVIRRDEVRVEDGRRGLVYDL